MSNYEYREKSRSAPLLPKRKALLKFSKFTTDTWNRGNIVDISLLLLVKQ